MCLDSGKLLEGVGEVPLARVFRRRTDVDYLQILMNPRGLKMMSYGFLCPFIRPFTLYVVTSLVVALKWGVVAWQVDHYFDPKQGIL